MSSGRYSWTKRILLNQHRALDYIEGTAYNASIKGVSLLKVWGALCAILERKS